MIVLLALLAPACGTIKRAIENRDPIRRVTPAVAFEILRDNPVLAIVDLREPDEFAGPSGHLRGARNLPLADLERRLGELTVWRELAPLREMTFLVYCRAGDACGEDGMRRLLEGGYANAVLLDGGIEAWTAGGFAVLAPQPAILGDSTVGGSAPNHWRRLSDGELIEGGRDSATGLFVAGRVREERFVPMGHVEGFGEFCVGWRRRTGDNARAGWLELRDGKFYADTVPRDPKRPYVRGCLCADGAFRPNSRNVE